MDKHQAKLKQVGLRVDAALWKEFKLSAVRSDLTLPQWMIQACVAALETMPEQKRQRVRASVED